MDLAGQGIDHGECEEHRVGTIEQLKEAVKALNKLREDKATPEPASPDNDVASDPPPSSSEGKEEEKEEDFKKTDELQAEKKKEEEQAEKKKDEQPRQKEMMQAQTAQLKEQASH